MDEISTLFVENINIDKILIKNLNISLSMKIRDIDIDKGILQNIDIDKILYR